MRWRNASLQAGLLAALLCPAAAVGFESPGTQTTYLHKRSLLFNVGFGTADIINNKAIDGDPGFGFRFGFTLPLSRYLGVDLMYHLAWMPMQSPDPNPEGTRIKTDFIFNQGYTRLLASYPAKWWQPYLCGGIGVYNFIGVDGRTGLSFPANLEFPFGAGINAYVWGDRISLRAEFLYHVLLGEGQSQQVLDLLDVPQLNFDVYTLTLEAVFAFF